MGQALLRSRCDGCVRRIEASSLFYSTFCLFFDHSCYENLCLTAPSYVPCFVVPEHVFMRTMIYARVLVYGPMDVTSPPDFL
jgi:hypothetical protein